MTIAANGEIIRRNIILIFEFWQLFSLMKNKVENLENC